MLLLILIILLICNDSYQQSIENNKSVLKLLFILQDGQENISQAITEIMKNDIADEKINIDFAQYKFDENNTLKDNELCQFYEKGYSIIFDITWNNEHLHRISKITKKLEMVHLKIDIFFSSTLRIIESYLTARNATDVTLLFENMENVEKALSHWIDHLTLRIRIINGMSNETYQRLNETNFAASFYVIVASTQNVTNIYTNLQSTKLKKFAERTIFVLLDIEDISEIKSVVKGNPVSLITYDMMKICCMNQNCEKCPANFNIQKTFLKNFVTFVVKIINDLNKNGLEILSMSHNNCSSPNKFPTILFFDYMKNTRQNLFIMDENNLFSAQLNAIIEVGNINGRFDVLGKYNSQNGFVLQPGMEIKSIGKFYRVGTGIATPWIYREEDPDTGETRLSGYCIDFIDKLAEVMNFHYELVITDGFYGVKQSNGSWNGLVGGLINGQIDIVVAPMTMTAEREEAVDFVTPIFATSGITIVTRKPLAKSSLFKFLSVLDIQVWLMIIGALVGTALILFVLDYCSPFSSRNMKYPKECRLIYKHHYDNFTLVNQSLTGLMKKNDSLTWTLDSGYNILSNLSISRVYYFYSFHLYVLTTEFHIIECFWFALTSFTPQGGGEPPQSLSGRILVGTYWIFVVLLLATFTANLSAFLTVERMQLQAPDFTLDQLIRQSKVNYTVIKDNWPHAYFKNMRNTENELYALWRSLALIKTTDKYRVWDYPIKEVYGNVLKAINEFVPVENVSEGYRMVLEHTDGDFAFIHDYSEVRYAIARTCYLVEVGKPFAERPYAVAVQQGSALLEKVGKAIQTLKRDGYFEFLQDKYWRTNLRGECPDDITSDGITVDSLGGAFIATIAVLLLAITSLIIEIFNIRGLFGNKIKQSDPLSKKSEKFIPKKELFEKDFRRKEAAFGAQNKSLGKFIEPQVTLGSHFRPGGYNFKEAGVTVVRGNYFTVHSRRPLHLDSDPNKEKIFYLD